MCTKLILSLVTAGVVPVSNRTQIGPSIDEDLWREFRENVKERKGKVRGVLGDELENAIRSYIRHGSDKPAADRLEEMDARLQRIEGAVGTAATDGGTPSTDDSHTHAPSRLDSPEKPSANESTDKKLTYLADRLVEEHGNTDGTISMIPRFTIVDLVKDEYGFRSDTAKRYVKKLVDRFDLRRHPDGYNQLVSEERHAELVEEES